MRTVWGFVHLVLATLVAVALAAHGVEATTLNVPAQYPIIQDAMDAAQAGDTVLVAAGTYATLRQPPGPDTTKCVVFFKSGVTLRGSGRGVTILDAQDRGRGIHCRNVTGGRIERLTVRRAFTAAYGAGVLCEQSSNPAIRDIEVTRCGDGGIICLGSSPTIAQSFVTYNVGKQGGGLAIENGSSPQITDTRITNNAAPAGGGVFIRGGSAPTMTRCVVQDDSLNTVNGAGAGIGLVSATLTITDSQILNNVGTGPGGGIAVIDNSILNATRCDIIGNTTSDDYGPGGGIYTDFSDMTIDRCLIARNSAPGISSDGGGIAAVFANQIVIRGSTIAANGTNAAPGLGGGIALLTSSPTIESSIIAFNNPGRGIACADGASVPVTSCSDLFGNQGGNQICGTNGGDNFSQDPLFCSLATNDFTLRRNSPCLDNQHPSGAPCGQIGARALGTCEGIGIAEEEAAPGDPLRSYRAAPNPFGTQTVFEFELGRPGELALTIYDVDGRRVRLLADERMAAGKHTLAWNGRDDQGRLVASGVYYYRLTGAGWPGRTGRLVLAR